MIRVISLFISTPSTKTKFGLSETSITSKYLHPLNGFPSIELTDLGILIEESLQHENAQFIIVSTESEIMTEFNSVQLENKFSLIDVTELGITTKANELQDSNAFSPIDTTELGIDIDTKLEQLVKAFSPILMTELGIVIDDKDSQSSNASFPMDSIKLKSNTDSNELQK